MRILHTMLRVGDLDRSIAFYTQVLGMKVLRRSEYPSGRFTNVFVGYGPETEQAVLELTHNWDTKSYDLGTGYGHVALEVDDARVAELPAVEPDGVRADARRQGDLVEEIGVEARDFQQEASALGVPVEREVAVELLQPARRLRE